MLLADGNGMMFPDEVVSTATPSSTMPAVATAAPTPIDLLLPTATNAGLAWYWWVLGFIALAIVIYLIVKLLRK